MTARLVGSLRVPGDKSTAHRALILAALAEGPSRILGCPDSADVASTRRCLVDLGHRIEQDGTTWVVHPAEVWKAGLRLDAGNSGTTARLLAGALAGRGLDCTIHGDESLSRRPMDRVAEPLRALGAQVSTTEGRLPLRIRSASLSPTAWTARAPSAQIKTAFLLAALGAEGVSSYREKVQTRDHGERLLIEFGADLVRSPSGELRLRGGRPLRGRDVTVHGDPSSAAVLVTAAVLLPGSEIEVEDVDESPTRRGLVRVLNDMGAGIEERADGDIRARGSELVGARIAAKEVPSLVDEVPLLVLAAARAKGESVFEGLGELRLKESDRLAAVTELLEALGVPYELQGDDLRIQGGGPLRPVDLDSRGDHRLAMLSAVLALLVPGSAVREDPSVAVSWPAFYDDLKALVR